MINMTNPHNHIFKTSEVDYLTIPTSKSDKFFSGLGLHRIQQILNHYQGFMKINTDNYIFSISIFLPLDIE